MNPTRTTVAVPVNSSGDATVFSPVLSGKIVNVFYVPDGTTPYDNTADFTITAEATGQSIVSVSNVSAAATYTPRQATQSTAGAAALYAAGGTAINDDIIIAQDRVKIVVAQGGNTKTGSFIIVTA